MTKEVLKLALEALEQIKQETFHPAKVFSHNHAIIAIKESLAQPSVSVEQEPVGKFAKFTNGIWWEVTDGSAGVPLYTTPPQRKPLTHEQREEIAKGWRGRNWTVGDIIDAIEAAHGIKENT